MTKTVYDHAYFEQLYQDNQGDPWRYEQRWYEQRKRNLSLAILPKAVYTHGFEIGCSNGVLSAELAKRCEQLTCIDAHPTALQLARHRLSALTHVNIIQGIIPTDLPSQQFDLIVVSEILYYLDPTPLKHCIDWINEHLAKTGTIIACHWRSRIDGFSLDAQSVHDSLKQQLRYHHYAHLNDPDFLMDIWTASDQSLAKQEGLK